MNIRDIYKGHGTSLISKEEYNVSLTKDFMSFLHRLHPKKISLGEYKNSHKEIGYINYIRRKNKIKRC